MNASLDALHPIFIPVEVGFFPLSDGYITLAIFVASLFVSLMAFRVVAFRKNRFKREAIRELKSKRKTLHAREVFELLKRVALSCDKRENVASLSGVAFLEYFSLQEQEVFVKAQDSIYDERVVLSDSEIKELYHLSLNAIRGVEYVRD